MKGTEERGVSRRNFVKGTFAGAVAGAGLFAGSSMFGCAPKGHRQEQPEAAEETIAWSQCNVNCGGNCVFQWHVKDGKVQYMESDNTGDDALQARACLRGRSMRRWLNSPDRLLHPMKRVGKRGEGKFEQIGWDEAVQTIADKLKYTIDTYGNDAIYVNYATGMYSATGNPSARLLNLLGGYLKRSYDYSTNMLSAALPFLYGDECGPYDDVYASSMTEAEANPIWW